MSSSSLTLGVLVRIVMIGHFCCLIASLTIRTSSPTPSCISSSSLLHLLPPPLPLSPFPLSRFPLSPSPSFPFPPSHPIASTADTCHYLGPVGDLEEYILSTVGKIWIGTADSSYGRPWQHSQFMKDTLEVALSLLEKMKEDSFDPVKVS